MLNRSTHLLTEYFAAVNAADDEQTAISSAVELAAEMVSSERGAVVREGRVSCAYGFGNAVPEAGLLAVAAGESLLDLPGVGELHAVANPLGGENADALIVCRAGEPFGAGERQMERRACARGVADVVNE